MKRREILFRGQTRRYGEKVNITSGEPLKSNWVYGGIFPNNDGGDFAIIYQQEPNIKKFSVYAETVGQYTGLTDKNGVKIFEGDILYDEYNESNCLVIFDEGSFCISEDNINQSIWGCSMTGFEVIGNIHDSPQMLE